LDSTQVCQFKKEFSSWHPFHKQAAENAPTQPGVYVLRKAKGERFGRLKGESDILYIGSTEAGNGLKQRIQQYFHPGPSQWANRRINEYTMKYSMEISWCPCDEPRNFEHSLLKQYLKEHDELPPFNHAGIRRLYKSVADTIGLTATVTVIKRTAEQAK